MTKNEVKLLPCPFCGGADRLCVEHMEGTVLHPAYRVRCDYCGASTRYTDNDYRTVWNTRATVDALGAVRELEAHWFRQSRDETLTVSERANYLGFAGMLQSALAQAPAVRVTDEMVRLADEARENTIRKVASYGSAGIEERYLMGMRAALEAAIVQRRNDQV